MKVDLSLGTVRTQRLELLWAYLAVVAAAVFALVTAIASRGTFGIIIMPIYVLGPVLSLAMRPSVVRQGSVSASPDGLFLDDELLRPRAKLAMGVLRVEKDGMWLRFSGHGLARGHLLDVAVRDEEEARAVLAALALDARSTTSTFVLSEESGPSPVWVGLLAGLVIAALAGVAAAFTALHGNPVIAKALWLATFAVLLLIVLRLRQASTRVVVGADGLSFRAGRGKARFVGHDRITDVRAEGATVVVELAGGEPALRWKAGIDTGGKAPPDDAQLMAQAICDRIRDARTAFVELAGELGALPAMARAGRTTRDWLSELRKLGDERTEHGFREASISRERLWHVAEASQAPELARVAAAVALAKSASGEEKERLRAIAARSASPGAEAHLRVAVDSTKDDEIERMLEEIERETAGRA